MRPIIVVPSYPRVPEHRIKGWNTDNVGVPSPYLEALRRAGGIESIVMTEALDADAVDQILHRTDGVLLLGGGDLDPATYGADRATEKIFGVSAHRDTTELDLVRAAVARGMPVLAICRGHQVLNVALGGALDQHIPDRDGVSEHGRPGAAGGGLEHKVRVESGTRLANALGADRVVASCHHHQAVETPGDGLRVVARAADGIIEGTELADASGPWIVSVQWHPEDTAATDPAQQGLFDELVRRATA
jgi:putative glutamine amidotransferase